MDASEADRSRSQQASSSLGYHYELRVAGHLNPDWSEWFDGLAIMLLESGDTLLSGRVTDQAALHGLLDRIRDLNLELLSVRRL